MVELKSAPPFVAGSAFLRGRPGPRFTTGMPAVAAVAALARPRPRSRLDHGLRQFDNLLEDPAHASAVRLDLAHRRSQARKSVRHPTCSRFPDWKRASARRD